MACQELLMVINKINSAAESINSNLDLKTVTDSFRYLRNVCGKDPDCRSEILQSSPILSSTKIILYHILNSVNTSEDQLLCLQIGLQFIGNLIVNNPTSQKEIWPVFKEILERCIKFKENKIKNVTAMIIYNIFLGNPEFINELDHSFEDLYDLTLNEATSEFAVFILELFLLNSNYIIKNYNDLRTENKLIMLEVTKSFVTEQNNHTVNSNLVNYFSKQFCQKSDLILKTTEKFVNSLDPVEVVKILELLVTFSSDDKQTYLSVIQKETSLLINCIALLKNIHAISKQGGNDFSMISKISEINEVEKSAAIQEHPVFGLKCSLIRIIGNFCWKNEKNQDQVRELECIPVLLDCCNIDARNPFIIQWCVLAIRNICEKNIENQKVIAAMSQKGQIDSSRLQELGITLNVSNSGDSLCIAPLK